MKRHLKALSINTIRILNHLICAFLALAGWLSVAQAAPLNGVLANGFTTQVIETSPVLRFTDADFVRTDDSRIPDAGWVRRPIGHSYSFESMGRTDTTKTLWVRLTFDRSKLGPGQLALFAENNHERLVIYLNGQEIDRTFTEGDTTALGWYRPFLTRLPMDGLANSNDTIIIRVESNYDLVSGFFRVGQARALQPQYDQSYFWRVTAVQAANITMLVAIFTAFWFWLLRRDQVELLAVAALGVAWFARNYNFTAVEAPFAVVPFKLMTYYTVYPAMSASLAFMLVVVRVRNWQRHALMLGILGIILCLTRLLTVDTQIIAVVGSDTIGNALTLGCCGYTLSLLLLHGGRTKEKAAWLMALALFATIAAVGHDIGRLWDVRAWDGLGFYAQPFIGAIYCLLMLLVFGSRANRAFAGLETLTADLENRVSQARADLEASEAQRRALQVNQAIEQERTRIMREVHDGIGSNLVSALTIAERQNHPATSVRTLRRALSDLKMTVDSLEPMHGDIVSLVGNFRHRIEPDLTDSGIKSLWNASDCQPIDWLDAPNALHILRSLQEAIANVMMHSGATTVEIGCREETSLGRRGALVWIQDNGSGMDPALSQSGQGLASIRARMNSIGGGCEIVSTEGEGTGISLFLPYQR